MFSILFKKKKINYYIYVEDFILIKDCLCLFKFFIDLKNR